MTKSQLASVALKIIGIYSILQAIPILGAIVQSFAFPHGEEFNRVFLILGTSVPFVLLIGIGFVLIVFSAKLVDKVLFPQETVIEASTSTYPQEIQAVAFSVIGLLMVVLAIPKFVQIGTNIYALQAAGDERTASELLKTNWSFTIGAAVQFVIGFFVFIGAQLLSSLWHTVVKRLRFERNITSS